jgi:hypothetical protein
VVVSGPDEAAARIAELLDEADVESRVDGATTPAGTVSLRWDANG